MVFPSQRIVARVVIAVGCLEFSAPPRGEGRGVLSRNLSQRLLDDRRQ